VLAVIKAPVTTAEADGELIEVTFERVGRGSVVGNRFLACVQQLAAFAGQRVGHPDAGALPAR
jgi:hypothetical protein